MPSYLTFISLTLIHLDINFKKEVAKEKMIIFEERGSLGTNKSIVKLWKFIYHEKMQSQKEKRIGYKILFSFE